MHIFVCLAGLPKEAFAEVSRRPACFTGNKHVALIAAPIASQFSYHPKMEDYYLGRLSRQISQIHQNQDVGVVLAYVNYPKADDFVSRFFPFALVEPIEPFYYNARPAHTRRSDLLGFVKRVELVTTNLRQRAAVMRDHLSGQNFSPLTLPVRNFRSKNLQFELQTLFRELSRTVDARSFINDVSNAIIREHPLKKAVGFLPYFEDERGLRFKSPGRDRHGCSRGGISEHNTDCHINSRVRLGGPLKANFHYDCHYEHRDLDVAYPNCHDSPDSPARNTHVNIAPNDAIR